MKGFYFITDSTLSLKGIVPDVEKAVAAGVKIIQYPTRLQKRVFSMMRPGT